MLSGNTAVDSRQIRRHVHTSINKLRISQRTITTRSFFNKTTRLPHSVSAPAPQPPPRPAAPAPEACDARASRVSLMIFEREGACSMPPKKSKQPISDADDDDEDYRKRRDRNNEAVKKSRYKSKQRTQETLSRVGKLKSENQMLEEKVKTLTKELSFLKELFLAHASNTHTQNPKFEGVDLNKLLEDVKEEKD